MCQDTSLIPIFSIIKRIMLLIQTIVPILLIIWSTISLVKLIKNPDEKNGIKKIKNQVIAATIIFFIPLLVNVIMNMLGETTNISSCWNKANDKISLKTSYYNITGKKQNMIPDASKYEAGSYSKGSCFKKNETTKVLFVGNSKTYVANIPSKVKAISENQGYSLSITSTTRGGATLQELSNEYQSTIIADTYDCVILQEQTGVYMNNYNAYSSGASTIISLVKSKNPNVKVYIRALWATRDASSNQRETSYSATEKIAEQNDVGVIYDGKAFDNSRETYPNINLFSDEVHQTEAGAYLSAATIFKALSGKKVNTTYTASLNQDTAKKLQTIANKN